MVRVGHGEDDVTRKDEGEGVVWDGARAEGREGASGCRGLGAVEGVGAVARTLLTLRSVGALAHAGGHERARVVVGRTRVRAWFGGEGVVAIVPHRPDGLPWEELDLGGAAAEVDELRRLKRREERQLGQPRRMRAREGFAERDQSLAKLRAVHAAHDRLAAAVAAAAATSALAAASPRRRRRGCRVLRAVAVRWVRVAFIPHRQPARKASPPRQPSRPSRR